MSDQYLSDGERLRCIGCGKVPPVVMPSKVAPGFGICHPCAVAAANGFQAKKDEVDAFMASGRWRSPPGLTDDPTPEPTSATAAPAGFDSWQTGRPSHEPPGCSHHGPGCPDPQPYPAAPAAEAPSRDEDRCRVCKGTGAIPASWVGGRGGVCSICGGTGRAPSRGEVG